MERNVGAQPESPLLTAMSRVLMIVVLVAATVAFLAPMAVGQQLPTFILVFFAVAFLIIALQGGLFGWVMSYRFTADGLRWRTLLGPRSVRYSELKDAQVVEFTLMQRPRRGWSLSGHHVGVFDLYGLGKVRVATSRAMGQGVLLSTVEGLPILITPVQPEETAAEIRLRIRRASEAYNRS